MPDETRRQPDRYTGATIFVAGLLLVCGISAFVGIAAPLGSFVHDTFFLLDNAYRVVQGQVPHRDFSSAWGPVIFLIEAAGLLMSGMRPNGFGYANALFGGLIAIWVFRIVRLRWSSISACALGIYTILLITAPFPLGYNPFDFGYAMIYNRYGYALFGIVMIECAASVPLTNVRSPKSMAGAVSTGIALGLLAFLKISYAMVAVPFLAFSIIGGGAGWIRRCIALLSGFTVVALAIVCYERFDLSAMFEDLATAAVARQLSLQPLRWIGFVDLIESIPVLILGLLLYRAQSRSACDLAARWNAVGFAVLTLAAGYLLLITNQQPDTFPLNNYAVVILASAYGSITPGKPKHWTGVRLLLGVCFLPLCVMNGISLAGAAMARQWPLTTHVPIPLDASERGADLLFRPLPGPNINETGGAEYIEALNDGLALLRRQSGDSDGVLVFDEFNPFNYLLGRPSPRGGFAAAAYNYIFCDAAHPTDDRFFANAKYVMVRKYKEPVDSMEGDDVSALLRIYGPALRSNFALLEETEHWVLWRHHPLAMQEGSVTPKPGP